MNKAAITLLFAILMSQAAYGLSLFGPPVPITKPGKLSVGFDLSFNDFDYEADTSETMTYKGATYLVRFGYGIFDNSEINVLFGGSQGEIKQMGFLGEDMYGFVGGLNCKTLLYQFGDGLDLGIAGHFLYTDIERDEFSWTLGIETYETRVLLGLSKNIGNLAIYGGPFYQWIDGDISVKIPGRQLSGDLEAKHNFGGYIGTAITIPMENLSTSAENFADNFQIQCELQFINSISAGGVSLVIPFK